MSEIYVQSSSAIQGIIDQLTSLNGEFRQKTEDIRAEHNSLTSKWEGPASNAFQENFHKEEPSFENFASAIDEYVHALENILATYENAENANTNIAST